MPVGNQAAATGPPCIELDVRTKGFQYYHKFIAVMFVAFVLAQAYAYLGWGAAFYWSSLWIELPVPGIFLLGALFVWDRYPRSIMIFRDKIVLRSVLGRVQIMMTDIGPPVRIEGSFVWFKTTNNAPGFRGSGFPLNGAGAQFVLDSPLRSNWTVSRDLVDEISGLSRGPSGEAL